MPTRPAPCWTIRKCVIWRRKSWSCWKRACLRWKGSLQLALLPKDEADSRPAILEIRPGTGGEEAASVRR